MNMELPNNLKLYVDNYWFLAYLAAGAVQCTVEKDVKMKMDYKCKLSMCFFLN
jgi:hypothetical protein